MLRGENVVRSILLSPKSSRGLFDYGGKRIQNTAAPLLALVDNASSSLRSFSPQHCPTSMTLLFGRSSTKQAPSKPTALSRTLLTSRALNGPDCCRRTGETHQINTYETTPLLQFHARTSHSLGPGASAHRAKLPGMDLRKGWRQLCLLSQAVRGPFYFRRHSAPEQAYSSPECLRPRARSRS